MLTQDTANFAKTLERVCVETVEAGYMTKDLAIEIDKNAPRVTTQDFLDKLDAN